MPNTDPKSDLTGNELFLTLKSKFPSIKLGNTDGESTVDPKEAVFFDFDFVIHGEKIASVSISIAEEGVLKLFYSNDILQSQDSRVKNKWFDFLKDMRLFAKKRLMAFQPTDITKKNLDRRDYQQMSANVSPMKSKEDKMTESALYGSTKSSYQKLENARLIIRHSQKVQEETANSRTRNIDSIYVENAQGERFRYPFNHLAGARAMMRHLANGGNPYDSFGQYIVGLSENVYNLRKFNNLMHRNAFLENTELTNIASAAREKTLGLKKIIERIQKQHGYETVKENFTEYKRTELDADTLNSLKERFTIQQFNEELVDLFPYISDLLGENISEDLGSAAAIGGALVGTGVGTYLGNKLGNKIADLKKKKKKTDKKEDSVSEGGIAEIGKMLGGKIGEAPKTKVTPKKAPANIKSTDEPTAADAAAEPVDTTKTALKDDPVNRFEQVVTGKNKIEVEPLDKAMTLKAIDALEKAKKYREQALMDKPKDFDLQDQLNKITARLNLYNARVSTADVKSNDPDTMIVQQMKHIANCTTDDDVANALGEISSFYSNNRDDRYKMPLEVKKKIRSLFKILQSKLVNVGFKSFDFKDKKEGTSFEELESMLGSTKQKIVHSQGEKIDPVSEYEQLLSKTIDEQSDILSTDLDVRTRAIGELNHLISDEFPVGTNGVNAIESLRGIIDDSNLFNQFMEMSQEDAAGDARQAIVAWIQENAPDIMSELQVKGIDMPKLNKAPEKKEMEVLPIGGPEEAEEEEIPINEIAEFVKSLYDRHTGNFPAGETGVVGRVTKKFGDKAGPVAEKVIEGLKQSFDENLMRMRKLAGVSN